MEELWKDMSLTSTPAVLSSPPAAYLHHDYHLPQPPRTPPHTALTLSSSLEFTHLGHAASSNSISSGDDSLHHMLDPFRADILSSFATTGGNSNNSRRVAVEAAAAVGSDRRQRRMIQNRESGARSRARKQAYTNELELELAQLRRENAMLIKREQDLHARLALAEQPPDKSTLQRCRSAPPP